MKRITIIICTYNRSELLRDCLQSLAEQSADNSLFDVLVINNNSKDDTQKIAEDFSNKYPHFSVVIELKQGLSHARNRGYKATKTEWISYVDDDAKAYPNYVDQALLTIDKFDFDCFGGIYLPWYKYGKPKWFPEEYGSNIYGKPKKVGSFDGLLSGGVIVFRRSVLESMNGFNSAIGMVGDKIAYGEETLLQIRMREAGFRLGFDPQLKIDHLVNSKKITKEWLLKAEFAKGRDYWQAFNQPLNLIRFIRVAGKPFLNSFKNLFSLFSPEWLIEKWIFGIRRNFSFTFGMLKGAYDKAFFYEK